MNFNTIIPNDNENHMNCNFPNVRKMSGPRFEIMAEAASAL